MTSQTLFWTISAAVLGANFLTIMFVWGLMQYAKHEKDGTAGAKSSSGPLAAILMPLLFGLGAMLIAFDRTEWLDTILQ